jgi:hypothetical protein
LSTAASWINASALLLATGLFLLIGIGSNGSGSSPTLLP